MNRTSIILVLLLFLLLSCYQSPIKYNSHYEGGFDPLFDFSNVKTIGFVPTYWTEFGEKNGIDELFEKQLFVYAKKELEKRGFKVFYIGPEFLEYDSEKEGVYVREDYKKMPDLILTAFYYQGAGNVVEVPAKASGILTSRLGLYEQEDSYKVQTYFLVLAYTLWSEPPKYNNKAWEGTLKTGSPTLNIQEQAEDMTYDVFLVKFGRRSIR